MLFSRRALVRSRFFFWSRFQHWLPLPVRFRFYQSKFLINVHPLFMHNLSAAFYTLRRLANFFYSSLQHPVVLSILGSVTCHLAVMTYSLGYQYLKLAPRFAALEKTKLNPPLPKLVEYVRPITNALNGYNYTNLVSSERSLWSVLSADWRLTNARPRKYKLINRLRFFLFLRRGTSFRWVNTLRRRRVALRTKYARNLYTSWFSDKTAEGGFVALRWWFLTSTLGLRTSYTLFLRLFLLTYYTCLYTTKSTYGFNIRPIFFLFLRRSKLRMRLNNIRMIYSRSSIKSLLTQLVLLRQVRPNLQNMSNLANTYVNNISTLGTSDEQLTKSTNIALLGSSLLPPKHRRFFFLKTNQGFRYARRVLRRTVNWRVRLPFLRLRLRWLWAFRKLNSPGTGLRRKVSTSYFSAPWRTSRRLFKLRYGYASKRQFTRCYRGPETPGIFSNKVSNVLPQTRYAYLTRYVAATHTIRLCNVSGKPEHGNLVPMRAVSVWRTVICNEPTGFFKRRSFLPVQGKYVSAYYTNYINRFFEYTLRTRVSTFLNFELVRRLPVIEFFLLEAIKSRLQPTGSLFSTIFFINEFIDITFMALKLKNFTHLLNYLNRLIKSLVIWDHRRFLVFFFGVFREQFLPHFTRLGVCGLHLIIRGKIGVGGNSRKRSMTLRLGITSRTHNFINTHTLNTLLNTTTGALGFRVFLFYRN